jgi:hypothetical protein
MLVDERSKIRSVKVFGFLKQFSVGKRFFYEKITDTFKKTHSYVGRRQFSFWFFKQFSVEKNVCKKIKQQFEENSPLRLADFHVNILSSDPDGIFFCFFIKKICRKKRLQENQTTI